MDSHLAIFTHCQQPWSYRLTVCVPAHCYLAKASVYPISIISFLYLIWCRVEKKIQVFFTGGTPFVTPWFDIVHGELPIAQLYCYDLEQVWLKGPVDGASAIFGCLKSPEMSFATHVIGRRKIMRKCCKIQQCLWSKSLQWIIPVTVSFCCALTQMLLICEPAANVKMSKLLPKRKETRKLFLFTKGTLQYEMMTRMSFIRIFDGRFDGVSK